MVDCGRRMIEDLIFKDFMMDWMQFLEGVAIGCEMTSDQRRAFLARFDPLNAAKTDQWITKNIKDDRGDLVFAGEAAFKKLMTAVYRAMQRELFPELEKVAKGKKEKLEAFLRESWRKAPQPPILGEPSQEKTVGDDVGSVQNPKESSIKNFQTTSGHAQGTQVNDSQAPVIVGSNPIVNIHPPKYHDESAKKTILMLSANSVSSMSPRWQGEVIKIRKTIERAKNTTKERNESIFPTYEFQDRAYINSSDLSQELTALAPDFIHISGYAEGISELVVSNMDKSVNQNTLIANLFNLHSKSIACIILSGCCLEEQIREISQYIKFIVAIPEGIPEDLTIKFIDEFYFNLASSKGVETSFNLGKNLLQREGFSDENLFPNIFHQRDEVNRRYLEKTLDIYIEDIKTDPNNISLLKTKASLLKGLGRVDEINETYEKIAEVDPTNYKNRVNQGDDLEELGDYEKAGNAYTKALKLEENDYKIWWKKAIILVKSGNHMEARDYYRKALSLLPPYSESSSCPDKYIICKEYGDTLIAANINCEGIQSYRTSLWLQRNYRLASYNKKQAYKKFYSHRG